MRSTWFAYECLSGACPGNQRPADGVVVDVRMPVPHADDSPPPAIDCPSCGELMRFEGRWVADRDGYGGRGNYPAVEAVVKSACGLEREMIAREMEAEADVHTDHSSAIAIVLRSWARTIRMRGERA